jgi:Tfp pilus assembly protein FimT
MGDNSHKPSRCLSSGSGFTLVELIAVMTIAMIMCGVAFASLGPLQSTRRGIAAKRLQRDLSFLRQRSLATGTPHWLVLSVGSQNWTLLVEDPANPGRANAVALTDTATAQPYLTQLGVDPLVGVVLQSAAFDGQPIIGFDWLGRPLNSTGALLAANGQAVFQSGATVAVTAGSGLATFSGP